MTSVSFPPSPQRGYEKTPLWTLSTMVDNGLLDSHGKSIWPHLLQAEAKALKLHRRSANTQVPKGTDELVAVRVLGWFIVDFRLRPHPLGSMPYFRLILEITTCLRPSDQDSYAINTPEEVDVIHTKLFKLGFLYRNHLLRVFRKNTGPGTPKTPSHPSRPSFDRLIHDLVRYIRSDPEGSTAKTRALARDGGKCVITGMYDKATWFSDEALRERGQAAGARNGPTEVCHLLSRTAERQDKEYLATAYAFMEMFGLRTLVDKLRESGVHQLSNLMTMYTHLHPYFDSYEFWLEEVAGEPHTYDFVAYRPDFFSDDLIAIVIPQRVTFDIDPAARAACIAEGLDAPELPDRRIMALRASCARVARLSGAAEREDEILREKEVTLVLSSDGASADLLAECLRRVAPVN